MRTITKQEAVEGFEKMGELAHLGETVVVTNGGKPWMKFAPVRKAKLGKPARAFKARLRRISSRPIAGVSEVLTRLRR